MGTDQNLTISDAELTAMISQFAPMNCWKVGLHIGSWLYFEMKDKILCKTRSGEDDWSGSAYLSVIDLGGGWTLHEGRAEVTNSADIDTDFTETVLAKKFQGAELIGFDVDSSNDLLSINFSGGLRVHLRQDADAGYESEILMDLFMPDGRIACFTKSDGLYLSSEQARRWGQADNEN